MEQDEIEFNDTPVWMDHILDGPLDMSTSSSFDNSQMSIDKVDSWETFIAPIVMKIWERGC